jgi:hypothetical protein
MVVVFSSTAASVILTPNSIVRMIVSATTDRGQTVASGTYLGAVVGECRNPNRYPPRPTSAQRHEPRPRISANQSCTLIYEEPQFSDLAGATCDTLSCCHPSTRSTPAGIGTSGTVLLRDIVADSKPVSEPHR